MLLSVVIPVYNEEKTIREIFERVKKVPIEKEIILVNDGSQDRTAKILDELKSSKNSGSYLKEVKVVHKSNGGKGSALKAGIKEAVGSIIIFQDADLEYDPSDYEALVRPIIQGETKAVMGSRFLKKQNIWAGGRPSWKYIRNHLGIRVITWLTNILYGKSAGDYEGCYKAFDAKLLKSIPMEADGFEFDNELVCKVFRLGYNVKEVPISYYPRGYNEGKKIKARDGIKILWTIIKWRFKPFKITERSSQNSVS